MFDFHIMFFFFNRYGEIVNVNLVRDKKTGKPKGFCFLCYEDQRSTILAVDNLNGIKVRIFINPVVKAFISNHLVSLLLRMPVMKSC